PRPRPHLVLARAARAPDARARAPAASRRAGRRLRGGALSGDARRPARQAARPRGRGGGDDSRAQPRPAQPGRDAGGRGWARGRDGARRQIPDRGPGRHHLSRARLGRDRPRQRTTYAFHDAQAPAQAPVLTSTARLPYTLGPCWCSSITTTASPITSSTSWASLAPPARSIATTRSASPRS